VIVLGWLVGFVLASNTIRIGLLAVAIAGTFFYGTVLHPPPGRIAPVEVDSILTVRRAAVFLQNYKQSHPTEGYPETIPTIVPKCRVRGLYEFAYTRERSSTSAIADRYTLVAVPTSRPGWEGLRSFALTEDGHLYATKGNEGRPANRGDQVLE